MVRCWRRNLGPHVVAAVLLMAGCGNLPAQSQSAARPPTAARPEATAGIWLDALQMTSASAGWALRWTENPALPDDAWLAPARTTDGARTWTAVTPPAARALLSTPYAAVVLDALDAERAWLAVTAATTDSSSVHLTEVFGTVNGGQTWTGSAPLKVPGYAKLLSFAGPERGWLLVTDGAAMRQEPVQLYRTADTGRRWSLAATTPPGPYGGTSSSGLPVACGKTGLAFATASAGWLSGACFSLPDALLVSRDGGRHWKSQALPVPASSCDTDECEVSGPQFAGRAGFLVIGRAPAAPYFLVSQDLGVTWRKEPLPPGAGAYPRIRFFGPRTGVLVSAGPQGVIGPVFYTTVNGGRTWMAVRQGRSFTQLGTGFDFVSAQTGFAWAPGADATGTAPAMYQTTDAGRTWVAFTPRLAAG